MLNILFSYDFLVVATGTTILAIVSAMVGCFSVYRGQSLVGDAIGHASYPGVVLAFICFMTRNPLFLTLGAALLGALAYFTIQAIVRNSKIKLDAALAIVLTGFFGLGMVLKTYTQGNKAFTNASQAGLKNYIFGLAAFIVKDDVKIILIFSALALIIMLLFFKELVVSIFDADYGKSIGIRAKAVDIVLLIMMIALISLGLKSVGAILISSFLIIPCICANQHTKKLKYVLLIAAAVGGFSSFFGTFLSSAVKGFSTGPMIILTMGIITLISMIFGKYGLIKHSYMKKRYKLCGKS